MSSSRTGAPRPAVAGDGGDMAIEAAIVAPVLFFLMFAGLLVAGRSVQAQNQADAAAQEAARAASLQQTPGAATAAGQDAIQANVGDATGVECTADIAPGDLAPGSLVVVDVTCSTDIVAGRSATFEATAIEVVDQYRQGEVAP